MKKLIYIALISILVFSLNSCNNWLNINIDPDAPTNGTAPVATRLPWIQYGYNYAYGNASVQSSVISGVIASCYGRSNTAFTGWSPGIGPGPTTPYQQWFVCSANNFSDLIEKAREEQAWHYIGAANLIHAMGFMLMVDYYGEMPYTEALGTTFTPKYDDGKTIFEGCLARVDTALLYLNMTQPATATPLSKGDNWNGGDVQKWIKLCYGMKARWLNNLSKKSIYNADKILDAINNGPKSNAEGTIMHHVNSESDTQGSPLLGVGDPMKTAFVFDVAAWGDNYRMTKVYGDLLLRPRGTNIEDPRTDKLLPSAQHWRKIKNPKYETNPKTEDEYIWESYMKRTELLDIINTPIRKEGGPLRQTYNSKDKKWVISSKDPRRFGDTVYCLIQARCAMQGVTEYIRIGDGTFHDLNDGTILTTGTFYSLPESETDIMSYHEMCFIKAEVLFRKGDKAGALAAYKDGIRAHIDLMQEKLNQWGKNNPTNPSKKPMKQSEISAFLESNAIVQKAEELTMADIMGQKFLAMTFTLQNWNDVRRFNYSTPHPKFGVVYPGHNRPDEFAATSIQFFPGANPTDDNYWFRRMKHCGHEINYNSKNLKESNPSALLPDIWSVPVWWDKAE